MICDHPQCTGVHGHDKPYDTWCPRTKERQLRVGAHNARKRYDTDPEYRTRRLARNEQFRLNHPAQEYLRRLNHRRKGQA
jgi:hypothetical protein